MWKQYFKQAIAQIRENRLLSVISIVGTALAICMVMVIIIVYQVRIVPVTPENKRDRILHVTQQGVHVKNGDNSWSSNGMLSVITATECFKKLTTAEKVSVHSVPRSALASVRNGGRMNTDYKGTDETFWEIYNFSFIAGRPYTYEDCESGLNRAVITESLARKLFGSTEVVGMEILLSYREYTVVGVVKDVSTLASRTYANIWIPYNSTTLPRATSNHGMTGDMTVSILAHNKKDFNPIRNESERLVLAFNSSRENEFITFGGQPDDQKVMLKRTSGFRPPDMKRDKINYVILLAILLLIPAINLSSMAMSRMQKRISEMGVRKAFGARRSELLKQMFFENLILTLLAGLVGLMLSYFSTALLHDFLFTSMENVTLKGKSFLTFGMLFRPETFLYTFIFCFILNLVIAGIPAWKASRMTIVDSLRGK